MISTRALRPPCVALVAVASLLMQGCANYQVRLPDSKPLDLDYRGGTMHAMFWGFWVSPQVMPADCTGATTSWSRAITSTITVVTLGIWMPIKVSCRCKAPGVQGGGVLGE